MPVSQGQEIVLPTNLAQDHDGNGSMQVKVSVVTSCREAARIKTNSPSDSKAARKKKKHRHLLCVLNLAKNAQK